ncbi:MAG: Rrf2 family transcriptional regulator [Epulopiscium sp. Nuni2H_MBin003]|nr:MAG: Rrf2 family transcriptional regulator [Epulopiscium sp. Nuni2H_MBin003]
MKLSTKGRYGLRLMIDIGVYSKKQPVSLKSISSRLSISESYLEQLTAKLKKHKLVISKRGAKGGYILAKDAKDISVGDILRALEGSLAPTDCTGENEMSDCMVSCGVDRNCVTKSVWEKMRDGINNVVDSINLLELVDEYEQNDIDYIKEI